MHLIQLIVNFTKPFRCRWTSYVSHHRRFLIPHTPDWSFLRFRWLSGIFPSTYVVVNNLVFWILHVTHLEMFATMIKYSAAWLYTDKLVCHPTFVSHQNCIKPLCFSLICFGAFFMWSSLVTVSNFVNMVPNSFRMSHRSLKNFTIGKTLNKCVITKYYYIALITCPSSQQTFKTA